MEQNPGKTIPIRVAMADDHKMLREGLAFALGMQRDIEVVLQAANGQELLDGLEKLDQLPDVVLLDIHMPVMDGGQTCKEIYKRWPSIKCIAVSMSEKEADVLYMLRNGAVGYLLKEQDIPTLLHGIRSAHSIGHVNSDLFTRALLLREQHGKDKIVTEKVEHFCRLCASERTYHQIADEMGVKYRTVDGYREKAFEVFEVKSRVSLVLICLKMGIIQLGSL